MPELHLEDPQASSVASAAGRVAPPPRPSRAPAQPSTQPSTQPTTQPSTLPSPPTPRRHGLRALLSDLASATRDLVRGVRIRAEGPEVSEFRCALCEGREARRLFAHDAPDSLGHHVAQCQECSLAVVHPLPAQAEIPSFYGDVYYGPENAKFGPVTEFFVYLFRLARVRALRKAGIRRGAVLDIGCARGVSLTVLQRAGYEPWGTELSEDSARSARKAVGEDRVRVGPVEEVGFADGQFDAITAWQVFEHLRDPAATLDECRRILRPGGALILAVPNIESWQARFSREEWFHLDVPRHLFHFSPETLSEMLRRHGFEVEEVSHYCLEQNPFGLMQSALHRLGYAHMGLYNLLRGPIDRIGQHRPARMVRYLAYLAAFPFAAAACTLGAMLGTGATFTIYARRA